MLALPFQRGISSPGMASSLRSFIDSQYDDDSENKFNPDITNYVQVREAALASIETATASSVQHLLRAHKLMEAVVPRLAGYESELRLSFTWFDAFKPTKKAVNNSMYFDWGCFLWNYAALECQIGSRVDRSSEEGIREANKHFQTAASALEYIIENLYPQIRGESVSGLTDEGLRMAMQLMLGRSNADNSNIDILLH
jgi:programmed cell death 6-interacting protein